MTLAIADLPAARIGWGELGEVALGGGAGLVAVTAFAVGLRGAIAASEAVRFEQRARAAVTGSLAVLAFGIAAGIVIYGLAVIARDGPLL